MRNGDLSSYIEYFEEFATAHPDVKFFHFGQVEQGMEFARSLAGFDYPFIWLEQPEILTEDNGYAQISEVYLGGVVVLEHGDMADPGLNRAAYVRAIGICYDLQKKMRADAKAGQLVCTLSDFKKEAVSTLWADSHYGWRMEFRAIYNINFRM